MHTLPRGSHPSQRDASRVARGGSAPLENASPHPRTTAGCTTPHPALRVHSHQHAPTPMLNPHRIIPHTHTFGHQPGSRRTRLPPGRTPQYLHRFNPIVTQKSVESYTPEFRGNRLEVLACQMLRESHSHAQDSKCNSRSLCGNRNLGRASVLTPSSVRRVVVASGRAMAPDLD